jgi:AcrR family transcriptional regulator
MELRQTEPRSTASDLIRAARDLFGKQGYDAVSASDIAKAAGLSRDSFYTLFSGKLELFEAVVEAEFKSVRTQITTRVACSSSALQLLIDGGDMFVTASSQPETFRILFVDAPRVLGHRHVHKVDTDSTHAALRLGVTGAKLAGQLPSDIDVEAITSLMSGAYHRAVIDGAGGDYETQLKSRQAIRMIWMGLAKLAQAENRRG